MKLDIRELNKVLDENLRKYKEGEKPANLYFLCRHDIVLDNLITNWFKANDLEPILNMLPQILWNENAQGFLEKTNPPVYVLSNAMQKRMDEPFVFYYKMFNYGRDFNGDNMLVDLLSKKTAPNAQFKPFDLKNRMFTVAYGFIEDSGNPITELPEELLNLFDVYEIDEDLQFSLENKYQNILAGVEALKKAGYDKDAEEESLLLSFVKKLIDTGFNINDCGVYVSNKISAAFDFNENTDFTSFKNALIEELEQEISPSFRSIAKVTEKEITDAKAMIEWLKAIQ